LDVKKGQSAFQQLPLLWISLVFLLGIAAAKLFALTWQQWILLAASLLLAIRVLRLRLNAQHLLAVLCMLAASIGGLRFQLAQPSFDPRDLAFYNDDDSPVTITGWLKQPPVYKETYTELWLQSESVTFHETEPIVVKGLVLIRAGLDADFDYGDRLQVSGWLEAPENDEDFAYANYLAGQHVFSIMAFAELAKLDGFGGSAFWRAMFSFRARSQETINRLYPDPEAALLSGILLGDESGLSDSLKSAFNSTGTRHIIAISGFNISIIAGLVLAAFTRWLGIRRGVWLAAISIIVYTLLVGSGASVVRAAIMALLALLANRLGREQFGLNTLAIVAAVMAATNPLVLWDVGFQLSFAATLGIMLYALPMQLRVFEWIDARVSPDWAARLKRPLSEFVFMTLAAQSLSLPILLYYFREFSLISLPANMLILPLQPGLMILAGLSVLLGSLAAPLGQLFALGAWPLTALTIRLVEFFASLPLASRQIGNFSFLHLVLCYAALLVLSVPSLRSKAALLRLRPAFPAAFLAALTLAAWGQAQAAPTGFLELTLLDVQGEAILIRTPQGRNLLINGGASGIELTTALGRALPLSSRDLDLIVLAGERPEQLRGFVGRMQRLDYSGLAWASQEPSEEMLSIFREVEADDKVIDRLGPGQVIDLDEDISLQILSIGQRGALMRLTWAEFAALLPLGIDFSQMDAYIAKGAADGIDLLLLADGGYPPLNSADWITAIDPAVAWLAGDGELSSDLQASLGPRQLDTVSELGWLRATTDGQNLWLTTQRGQ
jgi:competence protein ComEC